MMEQFTDKEIFDEFVKRFDLTKEPDENNLLGKVETEWISLKNIEDVYLGKIGFTFNERGQFIDDLPIDKLATSHKVEVEDEIYSMDYDSLIDTLGEIVDKLRNL